MTLAASDVNAASPQAETVVLLNRPLRPGTDRAALSRFRDDRWNLTPALLAPHADAARIDFASVHTDFRQSLKRLHWEMINHDGEQIVVTNHRARVPAIQTIATGFRFFRAFTDWLANRGCTSFSQVTATDLDDYLVYVKSAEITHEIRGDLLAAVVKIWAYRALLPEHDRLPAAPPWNGERFHHLLGYTRNQELTTPRIHPDTMNALLAWSLRFVEDLAADITAGFHEYERLHARTRSSRDRPGRYRRVSGELATDIRDLLRAYRRLGLPLPGRRTPDGELTYHLPYLGRLLDSSAAALRRPINFEVLSTSGIPIREGANLLVPASGTIDGLLWRDTPIDEGEARSLARHLSTACFITIGYLSGMRTGEVLTLERGCLERDSVTGLLLIRGRHWKGVHDESGNSLPEGRVRPDPWVVAEPVATAINCLESLHDNRLLFPHLLGEHTTQLQPGARQFRTGQARTSTKISSDIAELVAWVNAYCADRDRIDPIPTDPTHPNITGRRLRRTLAWFIARKPRGLVAAAIQYGHLKVQMTLGYAGTYASGFPDDLAFEEWLARLDLLADAHGRLEAGEHVSGTAADLYRHRIEAVQRFAGHTLRTHREARILLANPDLQIYPGMGMTCVFDPNRAACRLASDDTNTRRTPDLSDCRPSCGNIARTDRDIDHLHAEAQRLRDLVDDPLAPPLRLARERQELERLKAIITQHDQREGNGRG